jgi:hypothetical protein
MSFLLARTVLLTCTCAQEMSCSWQARERLATSPRDNAGLGSQLTCFVISRYPDAAQIMATCPRQVTSKVLPASSIGGAVLPSWTGST